MTTRTPALVLTISCCFLLTISALELPDTSGIDGQLTANLGVDHFFSLWLVFSNDDVKMSDKPFTILAPKNSAETRNDNILHQPDLVKKLLLDHVVLGTKIDLTNLTTDTYTFKTLTGKTVKIKTLKEGKLEANDAQVLVPKVEIPNGVLIVLDNYLFPEDHRGMKNGSQSLDLGMLSVVAVAKEEGKSATANGSFVENVLQVLSLLKNGVRVFHHFLSRSNVSQLLVNDEDYTVFVPTDHAFQRWHPIDWGFYPFSVPEFTESVITNHFIKGRVKLGNFVDGMSLTTLGGKEIVFKKKGNTWLVNGAPIVEGDTPVTKGNILFIGEVLFVSEAIVSRLHQQHRDKETPPLLAFPWFGAQFLSHAFLALERDKRFTHITRFLNLADLAPHVSGTGYTFFVPMDGAFEALGLDKMPDNYLSTGDGLEILLNHFVKGRLYDKDLKDGEKLETLGNRTIGITRNKDKVTVNEATIIESEVFVYNLGTMFYIDKVLFTNRNSLPPTTERQQPTSLPTTENTFTTAAEAESVPVMPDIYVADEEAATTPRVEVSNKTATSVK